MQTNLNVTKEVNFISPGFRRVDTGASYDGTIRKGYWTPELARWSDKNGFKKKNVLQEYKYESGVKLTGARVNACPVICVIESEIAERDLEVRVTGNTGIPSGVITTGGTGVSGFAHTHQYGSDIYRREWLTGGSEYNYSFIIDKHTLPGKTYLLPNKRIYEITDVDVKISGTVISARRQDQPLTDLGFYAIADNGSKLLYTFNWNRVYEDLKQSFYSHYIAPKKCPTCKGSGTVDDNTCEQCEGYGWSGWNSTGYVFKQRAKELGIITETGTSFEEFQNKAWAMSWELSPTKKEIQRYFAHFARIEDTSVEVNNTFRSTSTSGVESIVTVQIPYNIPLGKFTTDDNIWEVMAEKCEPAGVNIRFSFLVSGQLTGAFKFEDTVSAYRDYYSGAIEYTGGTGAYIASGTRFGFYDPFDWVGVPRASTWKGKWGAPFGTYCFASGHVSGDDAVSGSAVESGATFTWKSGSLKGDQWLRWRQPEASLTNDTDWNTGADTLVNQDYLWTSGTYINDNFWGSGSDGNIYY